MAVEKAIVNQEPKGQHVREFNKEEIVALIKEFGDGAKLYKHTITLSNDDWENNKKCVVVCKSSAAFTTIASIPADVIPIVTPNNKHGTISRIISVDEEESGEQTIKFIVLESIYVGGSDPVYTVEACADIDTNLTDIVTEY